MDNERSLCPIKGKKRIAQKTLQDDVVTLDQKNYLSVPVTKWRRYRTSTLCPTNSTNVL
jgi:hypothetical protein